MEKKRTLKQYKVMLSIIARTVSSLVDRRNHVSQKEQKFMTYFINNNVADAVHMQANFT